MIRLRERERERERERDRQTDRQMYAQADIVSVWPVRVGR